MSNYTTTFSSPNLFIGISGIIGVGKSTLTEQLASKLNFEPYFEPVKENEYLEHFYADMHKYSFPMQIYLLNKRFRHHQQAVWCDRGVVQDRTIYEDVIFAKMLHDSKHIEDLDFTTYRELFVNMTNFLHRPDVIIYLDCKPEIAMERIHSRSRECENGIPLEYLSALKKGYEDWLLDVSRKIPVVRIDWNEFRSVDYVIERINECLAEQRKNEV